MRRAHLLSTALIATMAVVPSTRAAADTGDFVAGAIVGGILGHAAKQNQTRTRTVYRSTPRRTTSRPRLPSTQEGRNIQSALNYFGFNAGGVDGQLGRQSRAAISSYQAYLGYPATGQLTPFEQNLLITSHNRAQAGGYATQQLIATTPEGTRGLLKRYRTEMAGGTPAVPAPPQTTVVVNAPAAVAPAPVPVPAPGTTTTTTTTVAAAATAAALADEAEAEAGDEGLPNLFGGAAQAQTSLASHCNQVSLLTSTNGGFTTADTLTDADFAMSEQFCLARTYAIAAGEELSKGLGASPEQVASHCGAYGQQMTTHVQALSVKEADAVIRDVSSFVLASGVPAQDLAGTAKVCLSVGYRTDDMDVAIGSALILATLGEKGYGELMGHHLSQGYGASKRVDLSMPWYQMGLTATPVFNPGQPERGALIRKAVATMGGAEQAAAPAEPQAPVQAALPTFSISQ